VFCFSPFSGLDRPARFDVFAMPSRFHTSFTGKVSIVYHDSVTAHRIPAPPFPTTTTTGKKRIYLVNEECMSLPSSVFEWKTGGKKVEGFGAFVTHTDERRLAPAKLLSLFFFFFFILSQHPSTNYTRQPKLPSTFSSNDNSMMRNRATKRFVIQSTENC
jgi:hypothetical protein